MFSDVILPFLFLAVIIVFFYLFYVEQRKTVVKYTRMVDEFYIYAKNKNNEIKEKKKCLKF